MGNLDISLGSLTQDLDSSENKTPTTPLKTTRLKIRKTSEQTPCKATKPKPRNTSEQTPNKSTVKNLAKMFGETKVNKKHQLLYNGEHN